jgi:hypothetical protein
VALAIREPDLARSEFVAREIVLVSVAALLYNGVRGLIEGRSPVAFGNAERVIRLEDRAGLFVEPRLHGLVTEHQWLLDAANSIYIYLHWPVLFGSLVWLLAKHPERYQLLRTALLVSGAIGLLIFAGYPMAPPRLLPEHGFVDTVALHAAGYQVLQPPALTNQYAAMPSFHFGWNLLVAVAVAGVVRGRAARIAVGLMPVVMLAAIMATANHFWLDAVAGGAVALTGLWVASHARPRD